MNTATKHLSAFAALTLISPLFLTSCETVIGPEPRGVLGWASRGFQISEEPPKQQPDPAIMVHPRTKGAISYRIITQESGD